jgi:hypothetical protein
MLLGLVGACASEAPDPAARDRDDVVEEAGPSAEQPSADASTALDARTSPARDARVPVLDAASAPDAEPPVTSSDSATPSDDSTLCPVAPIPAEVRSRLKLNAFYTRQADADGVPVVGSDAPSDDSLHRACLLILDYTRRPDIHDTAVRTGTYFIMMAKSEKTVDHPPFAYLGDLDWRARGLGGTPAGICAEENVLCDRAADRWRGESICVHEFAHTMQLGVYNVLIKDFQSRLNTLFRAATGAGKWANTYAGEQPAEYFAEAVQDWYNTNLESARPNGVHGPINTRSELKEYDPELYALLAEILPDQPTYKDCYYYDN